jgi:hypothetical protein
MMRSDCVFVPAEAAEPAQAVQAMPPAQAVQAMPPAQAVQAMPPAQAVQAMPPAQAVMAMPPAQAEKKRVCKGRKVKTAAKNAAKLALKKKNATKKGCAPRLNPRRAMRNKLHFRFRHFMRSLAKLSATRNLCNSRTVASAERVIAKLSKAIHGNKA